MMKPRFPGLFSIIARARNLLPGPAYIAVTSPERLPADTASPVPLHAAVDHGENDSPDIRRGNQHHADRFIPGVFGFIYVLSRLYPVFRNDAECVRESEPPIIENKRITRNRHAINDKGSTISTLHQRKEAIRLGIASSFFTLSFFRGYYRRTTYSSISSHSVVNASASN